MNVGILDRLQPGSLAAGERGSFNCLLTAKEIQAGHGSTRRAWAWAAVAVASFHLAFLVPQLAVLMGVFLYGLLALTELRTARQTFYAGLVAGVLCYGPHLLFFWTIFGAVAVVLWGVVAFWVGTFVGLLWSVRRRFGLKVAALLAPVVWLGLEYFRSELYYLRFSWLTVGFAFHERPAAWGLSWFGVHGIGFVLMMLVAWVWTLPVRRALWVGPACVVILGAVTQWIPSVESNPAGTARKLRVAGMQMEFPGPVELMTALDELLLAHPEADLLFLSEYTFDGPVPDRVRQWCKSKRRYLLVGGKDLLPGGHYYNTAFVIGPDGEIAFRQVKSVPIQFFNDGLPALERKVWVSPWGRLGIPTCYDLSYTRVVDDFVRAGAEALLVPTMDTVDWGRYQHEMHGWVGPVRAAEHGLPVVRLASSGISQVVDRHGRVVASAPFPGDRAQLAGELELIGPGRLPVDRYLAPISVGVILLLIPVLIIASRRNRVTSP